MTFKLRQKHINEFQNSGILKIKNFFNKEDIKNLKNNLIQKLRKKNSFDCYFENLNGKRLLRRIEKLSKNSKDFSNLLNNRYLKETLKKLSLKKHYLFKDKLNFKYPNSKGFNHHIDGHWHWKNQINKKEFGWKKYGNNFLNVVIPLENVYLKNGCLYLSSKQYTLKVLGKNWKTITKNLENKKSILSKKFKFKPYPINIGDILIFDWKVCHYSKKNLSNFSRMIIYATFSDKKNQMKKYYLDKKRSKSTVKQKVFF